MQQLMHTTQNWYANKPIAMRLFLLIVVLPTLLASIYYGLIDSDVYISEARFAVRTSEQGGVSGGILSSVLPGISSESASEDTNIVRDYILSHSMLQKLDRQLGLRKHYTSSNVDFLSRLSPNSSQEEFLEYYQNMVKVSIDTSSQVITLQVKAFDPKLAKQMANAIIKQSENLVNKLSERIVEDTLQFAQKEVDKAEDKVRKTSEAVTAFRSKTLSMDPGEETKGALTIIAGLEGKLAEARVHLLDAKSFMRGDSPQVKVIQTKVQALQKQIRDARLSLASKDSNNNYTQLIDEYQPLALQQKLAQKRYASALTSLEASRADAQRKQRYLLTFVQPQEPDEAMLPDRFKSTLTVFFELCLLYAIGGLVWAAIKDHMRL